VFDEEQQLQSLTAQLKEADAELNRRRKTLGGASGVEENKTRLRGQISTMENRVEQALKRYNDTLTANGKLRQKIDHLKQERRVFDSLHRKLEKELSQQKQQMGEVIAQSKQVHGLVNNSGLHGRA
jgi:chromosome segregation ATPase